MDPENLFNNQSDSISGDLNSREDVKKEWHILNQLGERLLNAFPNGSDMGDLEHVLTKFNRLNCPITLDSRYSTLLDVGIWSYYNLRLSPSTIEKHLRYARFMQNHKVPVDFEQPTYENFRKHMLFREELEQASPHALKHEWKAMQVFLKAFGMPIWPYKPPSAPHHKKRNLPFPQVVHQFLTYTYSTDPYETALYQYLFHHGFLIGFRAPSEICEMKVTDISIDDNNHGSVTIRETKKHKSERTIYPANFILSSHSHKSLKNYIDIHRPRVENQLSGDALFLQPSGKPFTVRHLGHKLSQHGKKIWSEFSPYTMRHWAATAWLIETKINSGQFDTFYVNQYLGHDKLETTKQYIGTAIQCFEQYPKSWIHNALRTCRDISCNWGKRLMDLKKRVELSKQTLFENSPVDAFKPGRAHVLLSKENITEFVSFFKLSFFRAFESLSKLGDIAHSPFLWGGPTAS